MIEREQFERIVARARLAPSVHNTQPARWRQDDWAVEIWCDGTDQLRFGDPEGRDAALSCGAALEATVLAMGAEGIGTEVTLLPRDAGGDYWPVARLELRGAAKADPLAEMLEARFTHRGAFSAKRLTDWARSDIVLVSDTETKRWLARLNDEVSLKILRDDAFRAELLEWMRLDSDHPRHRVDGMSREAMRMSPMLARLAGRALGPWWSWLDRLRLTGMVTAEAKVTQSAAAIACFHRDLGEDPVETGRAYMRMWLEATKRGMAGWPMASLSDDADSNAAICARLGLGDKRRLVQVLRFGAADQAPPPRARRDVNDLIID